MKMAKVVLLFCVLMIRWRTVYLHSAGEQIIYLRRKTIISSIKTSSGSMKNYTGTPSSMAVYQWRK